MRWTQDPSDKLDYVLDWTDLLDGDTISNVVWIIPPGITQASPGPSVSGGKTTNWFTGGTPGQDYGITIQATTVGGRIWQRTIVIQVRER